MRAALAMLAACSGTAAPIANGGHTTTPPSAAALVLFEPAGKECILARVDPITRDRDELVRFPNACLGARIGWRPDRARAVVWFDPSTAYEPSFSSRSTPAPGHPVDPVDIRERLYDVDLAAHTASTLDVPEHLAQAAYGTDGTLYAFVELDLPNAKGVVTVRGTKLDFSQISEGMPAAALAFARRAGRWELVSVTATTSGWDYARGYSAAPETEHLGPISADVLSAHAETKDIADAAARAALERIARSEPDGDGWAQLGPLYVWLFSGELVYPTGRIAWRDASGAIALLPELGFTAGDSVAVLVRGRYALIASSAAGMFARVYDLVEHRRIYASDTARAVTFWPP
jgi:hypothetical protein